MRLLPGGMHIALALYEVKDGNNFKHFVRLLSRESNNKWRVAHELYFDTTAVMTASRLCTSRNLLICAALRHSRRLMALQVTHGSRLRIIGEQNFDSPLWALCGFTSGSEHLVATAHEDRTVRLSRHIEPTAAAGWAFALVECFRFSADTTFRSIINCATALLLQPDSHDQTVLFCRINGTRLDEPIPQTQLGSLNVRCGCLVGPINFIYDWESKSLLTFDSLHENS